MKAMHDNLDDGLKEHLKIEDKKRKKTTNHENLTVDEKEQLRKYKKKGKKGMPENLDDEQKEHLRIQDRKSKKTKHNNLSADENVQ